MIENIPQPQIPTPVPQPVLNQPKPMLPIILALVIVALISGGGIYLWQQGEIKKLQTAIQQPTGDFGTLETPTVKPTVVIANPTATSVPTEVPTGTVSKNQISFGGISMTVPSKWKVESNDGKTARILTDYPTFKVELVVNLQNAVMSDGNYKSGFNNTKTMYGEAFKVAQGGAFDVTGVKINRKLYSFEWEIASNEPVPTNLDGIWTPKHNVTEDDIWNITVSAKPAN